MKKVILVGNYGPWQAEKLDAEIWCMNISFRLQPNCDRIYAMDRFYPGNEDECLGAGFIDDANRRGVPVVSQRHYPEVPLSRPFKLEEARRVFGIDYYTSTIAYAMAEAILEGAGIIVLHHIICQESSEEYYSQKACLDFWIGQAMGRGIKIKISETSVLTRSYPWQTALYGYKQTSCGITANAMLASVMRGILRLDNSQSWQDPETERLHSNAA